MPHTARQNPSTWARNHTPPLVDSQNRLDPPAQNSAKKAAAAGGAPRRQKHPYTPAAASRPYTPQIRLLGTAWAPPPSATKGSSAAAGTGGKDW